MSLIEKDIAEMESLLEHSFSKTRKAYYASVLTELKGMLYDIRLEVPTMNIDKEISHLVDSSFDKKINQIYKQISTVQYIQYINRLTKNGIKAFNGTNLEYQFQNKKYNLKEAKSLILEFFNSYDKTLYPIIKKNMDDDHLYIVSDGFDDISDGYCYCNFHSNNTYIIIYNTGNFSIDNIDCIVHELGHSIHLQADCNKTDIVDFSYFSNFSEMASTVFEKLFVDFLIHNKIDTIDAHKTDINNLILLKDRLKDLRKCNKCLSSNSFNNVVLEDYFNEDGVTLNLDAIIKNYKYTYGGLLAQYYCGRYREDPEKTKKEIYDFINCISIMNDLDLLNNFGINMDEFAKCDYLRQEINNDVKVLKKSV